MNTADYTKKAALHNRQSKLAVPEPSLVETIVDWVIICGILLLIGIVYLYW